MKRFYLRFRVVLITLALGLASVSFFNWFSDYWNEVSVELPKVASGSPIYVFPAYEKEIGKKFEFNGQGIGNTVLGGWFSGRRYKSSDGQIIFKEIIRHKNAKNTQREINWSIKKATKVLESQTISDENSKSNEKRIILEYGKEKKSFEILKYDGEKTIRVIAAPSLELALEFEKWWESLD